MAVTVKPLNAAVGAEISGVDLARLNDAEFAPIEQAWNRYGALLLRDQHITDDDLLAFSRRFGELDPPPNQEHGRQSPEGYPDIYVVSNVLDDKGAPIGALGSGEAVWHTDMSYADVPPDASMLYALEIPPNGGNTSFLGMQAAWANLPEPLKARLEGIAEGFDGQGFGQPRNPFDQRVASAQQRNERAIDKIALAYDDLPQFGAPMRYQFCDRLHSRLGPLLAASVRNVLVCGGFLRRVHFR